MLENLGLGCGSSFTSVYEVTDQGVEFHLISLYNFKLCHQLLSVAIEILEILF